MFDGMDDVEKRQLIWALQESSKAVNQEKVENHFENDEEAKISIPD